MKSCHRLQAGALFYAVGLGFVTCLILSSFILFSQYSRIRYSVLLEQDKLVLNTESGLRLLMSDFSGLNESGEKETDLFGAGTDSVFLMRKSWGAYEVVMSKAHRKQNSFERIAFVGSGQRSDTALFIPDMNKPISLCGKTVLKGTCVLPKAGIKGAYIEGKNFVGDKMVDGKVMDAPKALPQLDSAWLKQIESYFTSSAGTHDSILDVSANPLPDSLHRGFDKKTLCYVSSENMEIGGKTLSGNIRIISKGKIVVKADANLKDIVLYAPYIKLEEGLNGTFQAFASDSLIVKDKCHLYYPSALGIVKKGILLSSPCLKIGEKVLVEGMVLGYNENYNPQYHLSVLIGKESKIKGVVYCNSATDLKGEIDGTLYASSIVLTTPSAVYENHLLDVTIDATKLPDAYVTAAFFSKSSKRRVIKWLN